MKALRYFLQLLGFYMVITITSGYFAQGDIEKPKFPDVFQVQIEGIFYNQMAELDATLYYDRGNNRIAFSYTFQNVTSKTIYNFDDRELISIDGNDCSVIDITNDMTNAFFPFTVDKDNNTKIGTPEQIFRFEKAVLDPTEVSTFPSYVYKTHFDYPVYGRNNCDVMHIFTKPEVELPNCDGHACVPTLTTMVVNCPGDDTVAAAKHVYNFYRFRKNINEENAFQPPIGIHCGWKDKKPFPVLPAYFSFSFDRIENHLDSGSTKVFADHRKVWYDSAFDLLRADEFDDDGMLISTIIYDFRRETTYNIIASPRLSLCSAGSFEEEKNLNELTLLPEILFSDKTKDNTVYVGKRNVRGIVYNVWSLSSILTESDSRVVEEVYFANIIPTFNENKTEYLQVSHVNKYIYQRNDATRKFQLSMITLYPINNYRLRPKEWAAFNVGPCFEKEEKKAFRLNVTGPDIVRGSHLYQEVLEKLYLKLNEITKISIVRISELSGVFEGLHITEFTGWILDDISTEDTKNKEIDKDEAYKLIEEAAENGKLSITLDKDGKKTEYLISTVEIDVPIIEDKKKCKGSSNAGCYSGGSMAAASLIPLFIGIIFGIVGYYIFLKKRKSTASDKVHLKPMS